MPINDVYLDVLAPVPPQRGFSYRTALCTSRFRCDRVTLPCPAPAPRPSPSSFPPRKAARILAAGMRAGVALRPATPSSVVLPLLHPRRLLHCVDVLAVNPGFGGQVFDSKVLAKVAELRSICPGLDIQVRASRLVFFDSSSRGRVRPRPHCLFSLSVWIAAWTDIKPSGMLCTLGAVRRVSAPPLYAPLATP